MFIDWRLIKMSLIETVKDYEFADSIRRLANAADNIAEALERQTRQILLMMSKLRRLLSHIQRKTY